MQHPAVMTALLLTDDGPLVQHDYPCPRPAAGEALIRVRLAGICATDLELLRGYKNGYRGVLGHEFVGEVAAAPNAPEWLGRRVVGEINVGCGVCDLCRRGLGKHCRRRSSLGILGRDGAFADYLTLPIANLHAVPDTLPDAAAVFSEPLAAALQIVEAVHLQPGMRVCQIGDGRMGLLVAQVLAGTGCDLTVVGRHAAKLELVERLSGARTLMAETIDDQVEAFADLVVDVTGSPTGFDLARRLVRPGGTLVLKSTFAGGLLNFDISSLVVDEVTVVGSRCGPFAPALRLLAEGRVQTHPLVSAGYSLAEGAAALRRAGETGVLKVLVHVGPLQHSRP